MEINNFVFKPCLYANTKAYYIHLNENKPFPKTISFGFYKRKKNNNQFLQELKQRLINQNPSLLTLPDNSWHFGINYRIRCNSERYEEKESNILYVLNVVKYFLENDFNNNDWKIILYFNNHDDMGIDFFKEISLFNADPNNDLTKAISKLKGDIPKNGNSNIKNFKKKLLKTLAECRSLI